jgi:hypothetical protein
MDHDALDLVPLDDLKAALLRRFEHAVVAGFSPAEGVEEVGWGWKGDPYRVVGLMEELKHRLFTQQQEAERP